jgi:hypothetical protein
MRTKIGILKGYKNGKGEILIFMAITKDFTLEQFQNSRIRHIEALKHKYDRFETELI